MRWVKCGVGFDDLTTLPGRDILLAELIRYFRLAMLFCGGYTALRFANLVLSMFKTIHVRCM